jgi:hypothetical protein
MASDNTAFMIILALLLLIALYYLFYEEPYHNDGTLQQPHADVPYIEDDVSMDNSSDGSSDGSSAHSEDSSISSIRERARGLNNRYFKTKNGGKYKHNSYRALGSGNTLEHVDRQFQVSDVTKSQTDKFVPIDESGEGHASVNFKNNKGTEKDKYDIDNYLPQEKEKDWFETIDTVEVKNSHLINLYRPIGANTIGSTHKEAIYDIRGLDGAVCPKFTVSPWLQSSTEPDRSTKSLCS